MGDQFVLDQVGNLKIRFFLASRLSYTQRMNTDCFLNPIIRNGIV